MYKSNLVLAVKVGGKVLREFDDTVYLPFGSEYSLLLKNMFSRKVRAHVTIDGIDVLGGNHLIINAKSSIDLKRFITNGNMESGNAFKFIEKTEKIEKYRGNRAEDGLVTIEFEFEDGSNSIKSDSEFIKPPFNHAPYNYPTYPGYPTYPSYPTYPHVLCDTNSNSNMTMRNDVAVQANTSGITAPGSVTSQSFSRAGIFVGDGVKHTITIQLKGLLEGQQEVQKPVTVTRRKHCSMCGTRVRQIAKFCHECGASVEIV